MTAHTGGGRRGVGARARRRPRVDFRAIRVVPDPRFGATWEQLLDWERDAEVHERRRRLRGLLHDDAVGILAHAVIAAALSDGLSLLDPAAVRRTTDRLLPDRLGSTYRLALRQRAVAAAARYVSRFGRGDGWRFLGAEVFAGEVRLDLVWLDSHGRVEADELKTGVGALVHLETARAQAEAQAVLGRQAFGPAFACVRLLLLAWPDRSLIVRPPAAVGAGR